MDPQDDPEARIRQLESSLADVARTSELGTAPYTGGSVTPPPTPSWPYGGPFPSTPPRRPAGIRPWMVIAPIAIAVIAIAGGVAGYLMFGGSLTSITGRPAVAGGGGTIPSSPESRPSTSAPGPQAPTADAPVPPGGVINVAGVEENKTIACNDGSVIVSGVSNTVVITGHCTSVSVSGIENVITVDSAETISVSGFDNHVTYRSGTPQVANSGGSNVVEQG